MGATDLGIDQGGSGCLEIGTDLLGGGKISLTIRVREMGTDVAYEESFGGIPPQGGTQAYGKATAEGAGRILG